MEKNTKISGYLEKKGKNRMITSYKKYWFVLEGGLLLYYRSKDDYETISPCKGSINLGPPCIVKPAPSMTGVFQIQTRIATVTLRAENREEQNKWMQAIISEINPQKNLQRMSHFRYSFENIPQSKYNGISTPDSESSLNSNEDIIHRLQKIGAQSYNPIESISKAATLKHKQNSNSNDNFVHLSNRNSRSSEHIYEIVSSDSKDGVQENEQKSHYSTLKIKKEENRPKTFIIENDTYAISIQEKEKVDDKKNTQIQTNKKDKTKGNKTKKKLKHTKSIFSKKVSKDECCILENENYASVERENEKSRDHNENNLLKELDNSEEDNYSIPNCYNDRNEINCKDEVVEYTEPFLEQDKKTESKVKRAKNSDNKSDSNVEMKLKKRSSFIKRVWNKRGKSKEKHENIIEDTYESVPETTVEKICVTDTTAVQMLSELHNLLEQKMPILIEKISTDINTTNIDNGEKITKKMRNITNSEIKEHQKENLSTVENKLDQDQEVPVALPPKKSRKLENVKSLDEILNDLDTQKNEAHKNKVKRLIKRFSGPEFLEHNVELRHANKRVNKEEIDAGELSRLLEELVKITNAPILTPGVTSSLNGSNIPDEELSKLLPAKLRRFSEPDYDIPRPHKSLSLKQNRGLFVENTIGSTQFFGPILKPSDMILTNNRNEMEQYSHMNSIAPDSLETNLLPTTSKENEENQPDGYYKFIDLRSFQSSQKDKHLKCYSLNINNNIDKDKIYSACKNEFIMENDLYAEPRSISLNFELSAQKNIENDEEVYIDSLELCKNKVINNF